VNTQQKSVRVLGIDPGSRKAGWGLVDVDVGSRKITHVDNGVVGLDADAELFSRLKALSQALDGVIDCYKPDLAAVEDVFVSKGARSALILGQARGAALVTLARAGLVVETHNTVQVKARVTGRGRASKEQVQEMVRLSLGLVEVPFEDAADALAVAMSCAMGQSTRVPVVVALRATSKARGRKGFEALARAQGKA
jgi:crossover junction endodeoxyribonuclease RuvC